MQIQLYHNVAFANCKTITQAYSSSFSLAIKLLSPGLRDGIYGIYGFVRLADEIVDTFHEYDKEFLLTRFEEDLYLAIEQRISLNPVLHSFQLTCNKYNIGQDLIDAFMASMRKDLNKSSYNKEEYIDYIFGSADVVGLMCLKVFVEGDETKYNQLKAAAMKLGSAFQKVNFLRDIKDDFEILERSYFPDVDLKTFSASEKEKIILDIRADFAEAYQGIIQLPMNARLGVYTAYKYYTHLLKKLQQTPTSEIFQRRVSIPTLHKLLIILYAFLKLKLKV